MKYTSAKITLLCCFKGRVTELTIDIPHSTHASLQSAKGALIRAVRDECGGVLIRFPSATSNSDKVLLKGPEDDVEKAKKLLLDLANDTVNILTYICILIVHVIHTVKTLLKGPEADVEKAKKLLLGPRQ